MSLSDNPEPARPRHRLRPMRSRLPPGAHRGGESRRGFDEDTFRDGTVRTPSTAPMLAIRSTAAEMRVVILSSERCELSPAPPKPITIYVDADACPVKQEIYRVAERHALKGVALKVFVVSNSPIAVPRDAMIERVVVGAGMDEADNWIAERAGARRHRDHGRRAAGEPLRESRRRPSIAPNGRPFTEDSIGMTLATRNLMDSLRSAGEITGGPKPFAPRDRSGFLSALDQAIVRLTRAGFG